MSDKSKAVNKILGYGVDEDGFFTSDFNEAAGIPKDYKIYAKGVQNLADYITKSDHKFFDNVNIAKTIGNAYKVFSQLIDEPKGNFTTEDINKIPLGFDFNKKTLQITNIYHTKEEFENALKADNLPIYENPIEHSLSFPSWQDSDPNGYIKKNDNIFASSNLKTDIRENFYKNHDGTISKGGVLMAFFSGMMGQNSLIEGETTIARKLNGYDKNMSIEEVRDLNNFANNPNIINSTLLLNDPSSINELFKKLLDYESLTYKYTNVKDFKQAVQEWVKNNTKNQNNNISSITTQQNIQDKKIQDDNTQKSFKPIQAESKNKETYKDDNIRNELIKKNFLKTNLI
ncbi:Cj0814 family flagellar-dependent secreted protein [Campylobacter taeniopygiae]|uniref:Cj0814 family flagellar-dependent secreted protein n=1 Tax=Campylobacter taeniopygiae TaxID=2510188 RepID=UPI003D6A193F